MTDDTKIAATLDQLAAELRLRPPSRNWIAAFKNGDALTATDAASVAGCDAQTIRRWCDLREIEYPDRPLGYLVCRLWLVDAGELLREVEERKSLHARRVAETRLKQLLEAKRASPEAITLPERAMG
jgi:hypothetical protein